MEYSSEAILVKGAPKVATGDDFRVFLNDFVVRLEQIKLPAGLSL
jgi:hypothetical protein